ncbi:MAG: diphosphomevalonate decarboxylase [Chloroflexi bacterium]|nr:diphosphomevalonate decarboxylase [Chloroflexota bacterium]
MSARLRPPESARATALAHPNIALIKYWGNRDPYWRWPANGSFSFNLDGLWTRTTVHFRAELEQDVLWLHRRRVTGEGLRRVQRVLDAVREQAGFTWKAEVISENNFPMAAGIASSASAFAALAVAAAAAAGLRLREPELSRLARLGSGSAARSVPGGYVEWRVGAHEADSFAYTFAPAEHWALADCIAIVQETPKAIGSSAGHNLAETSPLQAARVADTPRRLALVRHAVQTRDFELLAQVVEQDTHLMHAVMQTSTPPLLYWTPASVRVMQHVRAWRGQGQPVAYTLDAGPNVHVLCPADDAANVATALAEVPGVQRVLIARVGGPARLLPPEQALSPKGPAASEG